MKSTNTVAVINQVKQIFSVFGFPVSIKQANFPPLNSSESRNYRKSVNTQDSSILPEHPHTNAVIKNFNRSLKKLVRTANLNQNIGRMNFLYFYIFYQHMSKREIHNPCYFSKNQSKHIYLHYKKGVCIGVILICIQSECGKIRIRTTPNTETFHAVLVFLTKYHHLIISCEKIKIKSINALKNIGTKT